MEIYRLSIKDNGTDRLNQVWDYISLYMGQKGIDEVKSSANMDDVKAAMDEFEKSHTFESGTITGLLVLDDNFGALLGGIIVDRDGTLSQVSNTFDDKNFPLAMKLYDLCNILYPYDCENSIFGCLELINKHPGCVIENLIDELMEREV